MTRYFWIATFSWPGRDGMRTWSNSGTVDSDGTVTREIALKGIRQMAMKQSVTPMPETADVVFFSIEPDVLPGGAK